MPHATTSTMEVIAMDLGQQSKANFGAIVTGVDLNDLDEDTFQALRSAICANGVVVIKGQHDLLPAKQSELVTRLDPQASTKHGFGSSDETQGLAGVISDDAWLAIPGTTDVQLVGAGYQGDNHYGLKGVTLKQKGHARYHQSILTADQLASGHTRFSDFHFDGFIYGAQPSRVTTLRCVQAPKGPDVTVRWDDGSRREVSASPGSTAFFSAAQLYQLLTDEEKQLADNSFWQAAPYPYVWSGTRKMRSSGLGMMPGGETIALDKLPPWQADKVLKWPMVWLNPVTNEKCFQILPDVVQKLYMKASPTAEETIVEDREWIRSWLNGILDRIGVPEYIIFPKVQEGDVVAWNNWGVLHSAVEYPDSYGPRSMHQCHHASSTAPIGPQSVQL